MKVEGQKTLNDYFSVIYCINLDRRPDRYSQVQEEFKKINVDVRRISGIDGNTIDTPPGIRPGAFGLLLTHFNLIEKAIVNKYDNMVIFEDDVTFVNNFNEIFNEKIKSLPENWELLYMGGNHILSVDGFDLITGDKNFKVTKDNYKSLNYELCKTPCTYCAHALVINSRIYEKILNKMKTQPIDNIYYQLQGNGKSYAFLPSLATQRPNFSDIESGYVNYSNMPQVNF